MQIILLLFPSGVSAFSLACFSSSSLTSFGTSGGDTSSPSNEGIGIDLGIKDLAICSDKSVYKNINKTKTVRKVSNDITKQAIKDA